MNAFSEELRSERESRNITLAEIARKTRINIKYLEALEQGAFDVLPQTYIRAFIKSYADAVGVPAEQFLHKYDVIVRQKFSGSQPVMTEPISSPLKPTKEKDSIIEKEKKNRVIFIAVAVIFLTSLIGFYLFDSIRSMLMPKMVRETSFQDVVKEQEEKQKPNVPSDSIKSVIAVIPAEPDTLVLRAIAMDSVWITIIRDTLPPRTGYMLKGRYRTYYAKKEFKVSISDAGAIRFLLNGKEIAPLGNKGERIRNKKITSEYLRQ